MVSTAHDLKGADGLRAHARELTPETTAFILVSFEGPDAYSSAGGLGVRVSSLAETLAAGGYETHLFFIGDPALPGEETRQLLRLHRWGQWISAANPLGVYDGENAKVLDLTASLPGYLTEKIIAPLVERGKIPVVLFEEWQTAQAAIELSDCLHSRGLRDRALLFWNANNPYSFDRIDWPRLAFTNSITTVSRYMRAIIRARGVDAIVIPNGIPLRLMERTARHDAHHLRASAAGRQLYFKMARWEQEKGWSQALDAILALRNRGRKATLIARSGGPTGSGSGLHFDTLARGLNSVEVHSEQALTRKLDELLGAGPDVINLRFGVTETLAQTFYAACDGVLANSISEPFGLVGLEAMAAGGVVYTGGTGEDYAVSGKNAVVLETLDASEIADRSDELAASPERAARIRKAAIRTARGFTWDKISGIVLDRAAEAGRKNSLLPERTGSDGRIDVQGAALRGGVIPRVITRSGRGLLQREMATKPFA